MTVHRFFVDPADAAGERFSVPPTIERQVRLVLRLRDGDPIVLLTGDGTAVACRLEGDDCVVEARQPATGEPVHRLTIVQALIKGDGLEQVVQHGTEIGVASFRLVVAERSVVRELSPRRLERLRAIAREAAEQSERGRVPHVAPPIPLRDAVDAGAVILVERHVGPRLGDLPPPDAVIIGPEGGLTAGEVEAAVAARAVPASLGPRILRSETVAVAAASLILSRTGDFA